MTKITVVIRSCSSPIDAIWLYNKIDEHGSTEVLNFQGRQDGIAITTESSDPSGLSGYLQSLPRITRSDVEQDVRVAASNVIFVDLEAA